MATLTYFGWTVPDPFSATYEDLWGYTLNTLFANMDDFMHQQYEFAYSLGNITGTLAIDLQDGTYQYGTATGNITLSNTTISNNPATGKAWFLTLEITQDGTGGRTLTLGSAYKTAGGATLVLSTAAGARDILYIRGRDGLTTIDVDLNKGYA